VAHACIPNYFTNRVKKILVQSQLGQIVYKTLSQKKKKKPRKPGFME
jgi:hypothetical protein